MKVTLNDLFNIPGAVIYNPDNYESATSVSIDSRKIKKGSIFFAISGNKFDGHKFVNETLKNFPAAVVINENRLKDFNTLDIPFVTVPDTSKAFGDLAKIWRNKLPAKVISITGSNGKTTTKEMVSVVLSKKYKVNKSLANNNNHIGVPLTIFSANSKHDFVVVEHGTNHFGEIGYTAEIAQPDIALITNIGNSHLEFLKNKQGVLKEKEALLYSVKKSSGKILLNTDDPNLKKLSNKYIHSTSYGLKNNPDLKGEIKGYTVDGKPKVVLHYKGKKLDFIFPLAGRANIHNFLAAAAIGFTAGLSGRDILDSLTKLSDVPGRMNFINKGNFLLIDDTYNSNPDSVAAALEAVGNITRFSKRTLILGDMLELGDSSKTLHEKIVPQIKKIKAAEVYTYGKYMKYLTAKLTDSKIFTKHFRNRNQLRKFLMNFDPADKVILIKGSRGKRMEEFVEIIKGSNS